MKFRDKDGNMFEHIEVVEDECEVTINAGKLGRKGCKNYEKNPDFV